MLKTKSGNPFHNMLAAFIKNSVVQLGIDPDHHQVNLKPHQLHIYDVTQGESTTLKFENPPKG